MKKSVKVSQSVTTTATIPAQSMIHCKLPAPLCVRLADFAKQKGLTETQAVEAALELYFSKAHFDIEIPAAMAQQLREAEIKTGMKALELVRWCVDLALPTVVKKHQEKQAA